MQALILNAMKRCGEDDAHKVVYARVESEQHESVRVKAKHTMQKELLQYTRNVKELFEIPSARKFLISSNYTHLGQHHSIWPVS